jgi:hypothetical protein
MTDFPFDIMFTLPRKGIFTIVALTRKGREVVDSLAAAPPRWERPDALDDPWMLKSKAPPQPAELATKYIRAGAVVGQVSHDTSTAHAYVLRPDGSASTIVRKRGRA